MKERVTRGTSPSHVGCLEVTRIPREERQAWATEVKRKELPCYVGPSVPTPVRYVTRNEWNEWRGEGRDEVHFRDPDLPTHSPHLRFGPIVERSVSHAIFLVSTMWSEERWIMSGKRRERWHVMTRRLNSFHNGFAPLLRYAYSVRRANPARCARFLYDYNVYKPFFSGCSLPASLLHHEPEKMGLDDIILWIILFGNCGSPSSSSSPSNPHSVRSSLTHFIDYWRWLRARQGPEGERQRLNRVGRREWKERLRHNQWVNGNEGSGCVPHPILPTLRFSRRWWGTRETNHLLHSMEPPVGLLSLRGSEPNLCFHVFHSCRSFFVSLAGEERLRRAKGGGTDPSQEWWTKRMSHEWQWWFFFASFHSSHHNHWP